MNQSIKKDRFRCWSTRSGKNNMIYQSQSNDSTCQQKSKEENNMEGIFDTNLKKREQEELIQQAYPMISNIFFDYLSYSPEYANSFSVSCADEFSRFTRYDIENIIGEEKYLKLNFF